MSCAVALTHVRPVPTIDRGATGAAAPQEEGGRMTVGFGLIGSGMMGRTYAAAIQRQCVTARVLAVAGGSRAPKLAAEFGIAEEPDVDALLGRKDVDVVVIATPHTTHLPLALRAAAAGKHVYLEKPMALDTLECERIVSACREAGVLLTVASQSRYNEMNQRVKALVEDGTIGELRFIRITSPTVGWDVPAEGWFVDPAEGGAFLDWGPHGVDSIRFFAGADAMLAFGMFDNFDRIPAVDPSAMVSYRLTNGAMAQLWMSYEIPSPGLGSYMQYLLVGEKGMAEFDRDNLRVGVGDAWRDDLHLEAWNWLVDPLAPRRIGMTARQVEQFARAVELGETPDISGEDGKAAIEMVEAALLSGRTDHAIRIPIEPRIREEIAAGNGLYDTLRWRDRAAAAEARTRAAAAAR
jgi:predicted dehydrogenase